MTAIEITVGDTTIKVEPANQRTTTVYNVDVSSPQAVIQRLEEHGRRNHEAATREERAAATARRAAMAASVSYRDTSVSSAVLRFIDRLFAEDAPRGGAQKVDLPAGDHGRVPICRADDRYRRAVRNQKANNARWGVEPDESADVALLKSLGDIALELLDSVGTAHYRVVLSTVIDLLHGGASFRSLCGCSDTAPAAGSSAKNTPAAGGSQLSDEAEA